MSKPITIEELRSIRFFHFEKGNLNQLVGWDSLRTRLQYNDRTLTHGLDKVLYAQELLRQRNQEFKLMLDTRINELEDPE